MFAPLPEQILLYYNQISFGNGSYLPSSFQAPSIWYADEPVPKMKSSGNLSELKFCDFELKLIFVKNQNGLNK